MRVYNYNKMSAPHFNGNFGCSNCVLYIVSEILPETAQYALYALYAHKTKHICKPCLT